MNEQELFDLLLTQGNQYRKTKAVMGEGWAIMSHGLKVMADKRRWMSDEEVERQHRQADEENTPE